MAPVVVLRSEEGTEPNADMAGGELGNDQDELVSSGFAQLLSRGTKMDRTNTPIAF
jgi:hypothetical protein